MPHYDYVLVDVFTTTQLEGNPLAVFPFADGLSDREMQRIAGELNLSETVFLLRPSTSEAIAKARIFTPQRELPFAGHPTVGSAYVLSASQSLAEPFAIEENVGLVPIDIDTDETGNRVFWLTTPPIKFFEAVDPAFAARLLNLSTGDIAGGVPPQFISAGSPLLCICLNSVDAVDRAALQHEHLNEALGSVNSVATFIFSRKEPDSSSNFDVYSRMFAPQTGIREDPATGGATGPLAAYMQKYGLLPARRNVQFTSEQGTKMGRRSLLRVRIEMRNGEPIIKVGGSAVTVANGTFSLTAPVTAG